MSLDTYTEETRADIVDENNLRPVLDEIATKIGDILARLDALENR